MDYTQLTDHDVRTMLATIGVPDIDALFAGLDDTHRVRGRLNLPAGLSEPELLADLHRLAARNRPTTAQTSFLGGGIYDHFIPTLVDHLALQSEFLTAYTPYQAEASQGILQAFYEFQTMVCQLTAMDVANASLYEGASAAAEAVMMAGQVTGRQRAIVCETAHPDLRQVLQTYVRESPMAVDVVAARRGQTPPDAIRAALDDRTAAVVLQHPNFLGALEDVPAIAAATHEAGALLVMSVDPISCALLKRPGQLGADIVVAEGQPLGIPQSYGGPLLGLLACRRDYLRKIPGRLVGLAADRDGRRGYCLTLQAREQHIRREKATSNVCTNQGLLALRATVYLAAMGRQGLARAARSCLEKAHDAARRVAALDGFALAWEAPFFKEFVVRCTNRDCAEVLSTTARQGVLVGPALGRWYPELADCFLVAVTENRTRQDIDRLVAVLQGT